ncbi:MAG: acyl-CoA dehydrogenase [Alphaproteobacteria bacterium]|nr:acyl-CoA dehydrogenase [Alphaproteobacteria bacterium]
MTAYKPPVDDMHFLLHGVLGFEHPEIDPDMTRAIMEEAAKLASDVLAPLNAVGDKEGAVLGKDGSVKTATGFKDAYQAYCEGGWNSVPFDPEYGGQGLPWALAFPVQEMWQGANMSFGLCPLLNQGAVEAILHHGTKEQKEYYLPKLISGEWTGTMNLTEAQAGSDLGVLRTKAERQGDGSYKITGQKIFITYGEHDFTDNIIHLVLARVAGAPDGVKGISLFIVPKILEDGSRNSLSCIGLEHKLGIHASPTCTMDFDGATGFLVGQEHEGLKYMFTMMNNARLCVGLQGVAIAERAYQAAKAYAQERVQGKSLASGEAVVIAEHQDVRRMLVSMRSKIMAGRALTYSAALALDKANTGDKEAQERVDLLTPLVKAWCTDMACEVTSTGIQVFGGMGFIEETGAAQYYRDARILPIYEGTNGIQALDFMFRKILRDKGAAAFAYIEEMAEVLDKEHIETLKGATNSILSIAENEGMDAVSYYATPFLRGFSGSACGYMLLRAKEKISGCDLGEAHKKDIEENSDFYGEQELPIILALLRTIKS